MSRKQVNPPHIAGVLDGVAECLKMHEICLILALLRAQNITPTWRLEPAWILLARARIPA